MITYSNNLYVALPLLDVANLFCPETGTPLRAVKGQWQRVGIGYFVFFCLQPVGALPYASQSQNRTSLLF